MPDGVSVSDLPVIWLIYPVIRRQLRHRGVPIDQDSFLAQLRVFNGVELPRNILWQGLLLDGLSFYAAVLNENWFVDCEFNRVDLRRTRFRACILQNCLIRRVDFDSRTSLATSELMNMEESDTNIRLLELFGINPREIPHRLVEHPFTSPAQLWFAAGILVAGGAEVVLASVAPSDVQNFPAFFILALNHQNNRQLSTRLIIYYLASLLHGNLSFELHLKLRTLMVCHFPDFIMMSDQQSSEQRSAVLLNEELAGSYPDRSPEQNAYLRSLVRHLAEQGIIPLATPKDHQCFYHSILTAMGHQNNAKLPDDVKDKVDWLRQLVASLLLIYFSVDDDALDNFSVDEGSVEFDDAVKVQALQHLCADALSPMVLMDTMHDAMNHSTWVAQYSMPVFSVLLQQPVWHIEGYTGQLHSGITGIDGQGIPGNSSGWLAAAQSALIVIHDGVGHWFAGMLGVLMLHGSTAGRQSK